jgi:aryl-alcohol dehydrogenase-like predicted oxidoreductase
LHNPQITAPIASATSESQLKELVDVSTVRLTDTQLKVLEEASAY